jgi:hypothetical protein
LIPLAASVAIRWLTAKLTWNEIASSPEILFFTLVVCASAMGDLSESTALIGRTVTASALYSAFLLGLISSAILYGCLLYDGIAGPGSVGFRLQLLRMSVVLAAVFFLVSTIAEIYLGRNEATYDICAEHRDLAICGGGPLGYGNRRVWARRDPKESREVVLISPCRVHK